MLGYTKEDLDNMVYGIKTADFMLDADQNPAIHNYLVMASDVLSGLWAEGYCDYCGLRIVMFGPIVIQSLRFLPRLSPL